MKNQKLYTTKPNIVSFLYFLIIYMTVIKVGNFKQKKKILDFGSGLGYLKKLNSKLKNPSKITNYDKITKLSDIKRWQNKRFDMVVFCQSAYSYQKQSCYNSKSNQKINPKLR